MPGSNFTTTPPFFSCNKTTLRLCRVVTSKQKLSTEIFRRPFRSIMPPTRSLRDAQEQNTAQDAARGRIQVYCAFSMPQCRLSTFFTNPREPTQVYVRGKTPWNDSPSPRRPQPTTSYPRHKVQLGTTDDDCTGPGEYTARVAKEHRADRFKTTARNDSALPKSTVCIVIADNEGLATADSSWSPRGAHPGPMLRLPISWVTDSTQA